MSQNWSVSSLKLEISPAYLRVMLYLGACMALVVGSALAFEHIGGYIPCALCLEQRQPYYLAIPTMIVAALIYLLKVPVVVIRVLVLIAGLLMLYNMGLGVYHSGVEWLWWPGPESCGAAANGLSNDAADLLSDLNAKQPPSCDKAALRVFGLSFAGWNVIASAVLAFFTIRLAFRKI